MCGFNSYVFPIYLFTIINISILFFLYYIFELIYFCINSPLKFYPFIPTHRYIFCLHFIM